MNQDQNYYNEDLAFVHDQGYSDLSRAASKYCLNLLRSKGFESGRVIELGCGSGYFAHDLSQHNYQVTGIDYSADILDLAKINAPNVEFVCASFLDYEIPKCTAVAAIDEIFNYAFDQRNSLEALKQLFIRCYQQLCPGGFLLFDVLEPGQLNGNTKAQSILEKEAWTMYIEYTENLATQQYQRDIHLFRQLDNGLYRKSREVHKVQLFDRQKMIKLLEEIGFEVEVLAAHGEEQFEERKFGLVCFR